MPNRSSKKIPFKRGLGKHCFDRLGSDNEHSSQRKERFSTGTCKSNHVFPQEIEVILRDYESMEKFMHDEMRVHILNSYSRLRKNFQSEEERILQRLETCREGLLSKMEEIRSLLKRSEMTDGYARWHDLWQNYETPKNDVDHGDNDDDYAQLTKAGSRESGNRFCIPCDDSTASNDSLKTVGFAQSSPSEDTDVLEPSFTLPMSVEDPRVHSVRLSHFVDPDELYVVSAVHLTQRDDLERKMRHLKAPRAPLIELIPDKMYLLKNASADAWHRVRVVSTAAEKENVATVYLVDYGHTKAVSVSGLMSIPEEFANAPPMALKCKLFECVPSGKNWSSHSMAFMNNLIGYDATMIVCRRCLDCLEVDLRDLHSIANPGVRIKSLCRELTLLETRDRSDGDVKTKFPPVPGPDFPAQRLPSPGESLHVVITHLTFPSCFYVQQVDSSSRHLLEMSAALERLYSSETHKGILYNPRAGMPCAAIFPSDGKWYRARVLEVFKKNNNIRIEYVDYGNEETVSWQSVRRLRRELLTLPPLAFRCELVERGNDAATWNRLRKREAKKSLVHLTVAGVTRSNFSTLKVEMREREDEKENDDLWEPPTGKDEFECSESTVTPEHETSHKIDFDTGGRTWKKEKINRLCGVDQSEPCCGGSGKYDALQPLAEKPEAQMKKEDSVFRPKVEVVSVNSPSSIYVTFPELGSELAKLQSRLNKAYENSSPDEDKKWEANEICAVFRSETKSWCRAHIVRLLNSGKVKVFLKDLGAVTTEPLSSLRTLKDPFMTFATYTFKCHMCDVCPAGTNWPDVTCEFLSNEVETHEHVYMTKKGEIVDASLPVELWVKKKASGSHGAEAFPEEWISLNRLLVNEGLALPIIRNVSWFSHAQTKSEAVEPGIVATEGRGGVDLELADPVSEWRSPVALDRTFFVGVPTFVDSNAVIYLYEEQNDFTLRDIKNILWNAYENAESSGEAEIRQWSPGVPCIARYHIDGSWYRAKVVKTNPDDTVDVIFVDYGNVENCQVRDVRKCLANVTTEKPVLSRKVVLRGIVPASECCRWSDADIDFLHYTVVDKKCEVTVWQVSSDPNEPSTVSLKIVESGTDVSLLLVNKGLAKLLE